MLIIVIYATISLLCLVKAVKILDGEEFKLKAKYQLGIYHHKSVMWPVLAVLVSLVWPISYLAGFYFLITDGRNK